MARWEKAEGRGKEERILVSVRLRPLNAKEIARNDPSDWDYINNTTIIYKNGLPERSMYPTSYTFDRVFGCDCNTRHVYDEGAKEVALSVVNGINASIFAYGQTSSGKTYTMSGITEYAVRDIYDYIKRHPEREFVLKFAAMEIYNEAVRDLLSIDSTPLRLLDDSERGTVVEKLTEETLMDKTHLKELISVCKAQRQVGETSLNEMSSRSHQILRLKIESTPRGFTGKGSSSTLLATVNFVDLAGSERASQAAGTRLKEGCHINRSLLTLGTVIRKLSKGRTGHIPYRDSKLTRILQPFLGGSGRTTIICTMSPARSHIEQSRNTLSFASCAKQVVNNAEVNVVISDKALVKHLQKELDRLENELRFRGSSAASTNHSHALKDKEDQIKKMEQEIKELMKQRDFAQSRLEDLLRAVVDEQYSRWEESSQSDVSYVHSEFDDSLSLSGVSGITYQSPDFNSSSFGTPDDSNSFSKIYLESFHKMKPPRFPIHSPALSEPISQLGRREIAEAMFENFEDHCKEVQFIEINALNRSRNHIFNLLLDDESDSLLPLTDEDKLWDPAPRSLGDTNLIPIMDESMNIATRTTDNFVKSCDGGLSTMPSMPKNMNYRELALARSKSCKPSLMNSSILSWLENVEQDNKTSPNILKEFPGSHEGVQTRLRTETLFIGGSQALEKLTSSDTLETDDTKTVPEEFDTDVPNSFSGMNEMVESKDQLPSGMIQETQQIQLEADGAQEDKISDMIQETQQTQMEADGVEENTKITDMVQETQQTQMEADGVEENSKITDMVQETFQTQAEADGVEENRKIAEWTQLEANGVEENSEITDIIQEIQQTQLEADGVEENSKITDMVQETQQTQAEADGVEENSKIAEWNQLEANEVEENSKITDMIQENQQTQLEADGVEENSKIIDMIQETRMTQLKAYGVEKNDKDTSADAVPCPLESSSTWPLEFGRKQWEIIELWHTCNVPLVHRSCFFLLFKGDPADSFYIEVECRRLSFLRNTFSHGNAGEVVAEDGHIFSLASSLRCLRREREMLSREMYKKLSPKQRERLYGEWGIALNSKQRRLQLAQRLWTRTDLELVRKSALIVAKLIGFEEQGHAMKEMVGLNFTPPQQTHGHRRSFSWKHGVFPFM